MKNIAIFASGSGSNFEEIVNQSKETSVYKVVCLIVDKPNAYAVQRAKRLGVHVEIMDAKKYESKKEHELSIIEKLTEMNVHCIVLAGYMRIISSILIDKYKNRILNIHPSLLPKFPGKQGIKDSYESNESEMGITIHIVDEGIDTGTIIFQKSFEKAEMSYEEAEKEVHKLEHKYFHQTIENYIKEQKW